MDTKIVVHIFDTTGDMPADGTVVTVHCGKHLEVKPFEQTGEPVERCSACFDASVRFVTSHPNVFVQRVLVWEKVKTRKQAPEKRKASRLSNAYIIRRINEWQMAGHLHPLTCGKDSSHPLLKPKLRSRDNKIVLFCPTCDYVQERIPPFVLESVLPPTLVFSQKTLKGIARDVEKLGKELEKQRAKEGVTVIISKSAWRALLRKEKVAVLRIFSEGQLHYEFGDSPEEYVLRVRISPAGD
jgi:hypothetical protein